MTKVYDVSLMLFNICSFGSSVSKMPSFVRNVHTYFNTSCTVPLHLQFKFHYYCCCCCCWV